MIRRFTYVFLCLGILQFVCPKSYGQSLQLFLEDFNGGNALSINSGGPGSNTGQNQWVVNNSYNGNGIYPNTTPETQTVSGTITYPDSNYLHIYNSAAAPGVSNCNYDNSVPSDNFAYIPDGFCTLGFTDVHFSFFWLAQGSASDYGTVYYSIDGGPWIQCGQPQYSNQTLWKYEDISLPAFDNQYSVRFGFRWQNSGGGGANTMAFGIDDIIAVGTVNTANPVTISITGVSPNPVCEEGQVILDYSLSGPLCDGTYEIYMSNSAGSFAPSTDLGGITIYEGDTSGSVEVGLPKQAGNCYKFRINRTAPPPVITGEASTVCLKMMVCPNTITTLQPVVLTGPDTLCDKSAIDVPFNSTGTFNANNTYIAQLSDANGSFTNPQQIGVDAPDPNAYPSVPPGNVSGLVPVTAPGCDYYIRVISTSPAYTPPASSYYGPFCIRDCDVTTNNTHDISFCIGDTTGADTTITLLINSWNKNAKYKPGNKFEVQLLNHSNPPPYAIVNTGGLGAVVAANSTSLIIHVPGLDSLVNILGIPLGSYYMRLISTNSSSGNDTLGSLVRLTIGYSDPDKPILASYDLNYNSDSVFCSGSLVFVDVINNNTYTLGSEYQWRTEFNFTGFKQPFIYSPPLGFTLNPATSPGRYWFQIQEINNGCLSPWSDTLWITVLVKPVAAVTGSTPLCVGDTDIFHSNFQNDTYYKWYILGDSNRIIKQSNNIITVVFDSTSKFMGGDSILFDVIDTIINQCGSSEASKEVKVYLKPELQITPSFDICKGASVKLVATTNGTKFEWDTSNVKMSTALTVAIKPDSTTKYVAIATGHQGCKGRDSMYVTVNPNPIIKLTSDPVSCYGVADGSITSDVTNGTPPYTYKWSNLNDSAIIHALQADKYFVTVTDSNRCTDTGFINVKTPLPLGVGIKSTVVPFGQSNGTATASVSGGTGSYTYTWDTKPPQYSDEATGLLPGQYTVLVSDSEGCIDSAEVTIVYATDEIFIPNAFSPNNDGINDVFGYGGQNLAKVHTMIFDRWGEKVFESESMEILWDGTYKGTPVNVGVYVYVIEVTYLDGKTTIKKGNVTVIR